MARLFTLRVLLDSGADRPVVKTSAKIPVKDALTVECLPVFPEAGAPPLLCGIEVSLED